MICELCKEPTGKHHRICDKHLERIYDLVISHNPSYPRPITEMYRMTCDYSYLVAIENDEMSLMTISGYNLKYPSPRKGVSAIRLYHTIDYGVRRLWHSMEVKWYVNVHWEKWMLISYLNGIVGDVIKVIKELY